MKTNRAQNSEAALRIKGMLEREGWQEVRNSTSVPNSDYVSAETPVEDGLLIVGFRYCDGLLVRVTLERSDGFSSDGFSSSYDLDISRLPKSFSPDFALKAWENCRRTEASRAERERRA